jgi:hypothetical protein
VDQKFREFVDPSLTFVVGSRTVRTFRPQFRARGHRRHGRDGYLAVVLPAFEAESC